MWGAEANTKRWVNFQNRKQSTTTRNSTTDRKKSHPPLLGSFPFSFLSGRGSLDPYREERLGYEFMLLDMDILFYDAS